MTSEFQAVMQLDSFQLSTMNFALLKRAMLLVAEGNIYKQML